MAHGFDSIGTFYESFFDVAQINGAHIVAPNISCLMFNFIVVILCILIGQQFDKNGNMRQWLSNCSIAEFQNRTQCFIDQYNSYYIKEINKNVIAHTMGVIPSL